MTCNICGSHEVKWDGWWMHNFTHTKCPDCGGINCQRVGEEEIDLDTENEPDNVDPK